MVYHKDGWGSHVRVSFTCDPEGYCLGHISGRGCCQFKTPAGHLTIQNDAKAAIL